MWVNVVCIANFQLQSIPRVYQVGLYIFSLCINFAGAVQSTRIIKKSLTVTRCTSGKVILQAIIFFTWDKMIHFYKKNLTSREMRPHKKEINVEIELNSLMLR